MLLVAGSLGAIPKQFGNRLKQIGIFQYSFTVSQLNNDNDNNDNNNSNNNRNNNNQQDNG